MIREFLSRLRALRATSLEGHNSYLQASNKTLFQIGHLSQIEIASGAKVKIGYPLIRKTQYSAKTRTIIILENSAKISFEGNVEIAEGCTIRVKENAHLIFRGNSSIAHDSLILCSKKIEIGTNSSFSWQVCLMDDDGHSFFNLEGKRIRRIYKPLIIGRNVGIQMNVTIPSGLTIGDNAVIAAGTILRQDVPSDTLAFSDAKLKLKHGFTTGFQFINHG